MEENILIEGLILDVSIHEFGIMVSIAIVSGSKNDLKMPVSFLSNFKGGLSNYKFKKSDQVTVSVERVYYSRRNGKQRMKINNVFHRIPETSHLSIEDEK